MEENYWKNRCLKAEKYIEESQCDPDIYPEQIKAYNEWEELKNLGEGEAGTGYALLGGVNDAGNISSQKYFVILNEIGIERYTRYIKEAYSNIHPKELEFQKVHNEYMSYQYLVLTHADILHIFKGLDLQSDSNPFLICQIIE